MVHSKIMSESRGFNFAFIAGLTLLVVLVGGAAYTIGVNRTRQQAIRARVRSDVIMYTMLYQLAERGDTNKLNGRLGFLVYGSVSSYNKMFGNQTETNASFTRLLADARRIASQQQAQVVSFQSMESLIDHMKAATGPTNRNGQN